MLPTSTRFGTDTAAIPLDPLCVSVRVLVGFGATDPITF